MVAWGGASRLEVADLDLSWGVHLHARGQLDSARPVLRRAGREGDAAIRRRLETWLAAVSWDLREPYTPTLGLDGKPVGTPR
ncbi:MAG: hypothetical protein HS111_13305 [Kofleriaceae bacterium]|nr:hypothetical protein [Kofleriaceae bacterium]